MASKVEIWNMALGFIGVNAVVESEDERRPEAKACRLHYPTQQLGLFEAHPWPWARRQATLVAIGEQETETAGDAVETEFSFPHDYTDSAQVTVELVQGSTETELDAGDDYTLTPAVDGGLNRATLTVAPAVGQTVRITVATERHGWEYVYSLPNDCVTPVALLYGELRLQMLPAECKVDFDKVINDGSTGFLLLCDLLSGTDFEKLEYVALVSDESSYPGLFTEALAWKLACKLALALPKSAKRFETCRKEFRAALLNAIAHAGNSRQHRPPITPSLLARGV